MQTCRVSNSNLYPLFSLGDLYVSDFLPSDTDIVPLKSELTLCFNDESKLLQLGHSIDPHLLYGRYWYRSGTNLSMTAALKDVVDSIRHKTLIPKNGVWLDIASNDGTLLKFVPKDIIKIGIDPVEDSYKEEALKVADDVVQDFFSEEVYRNSQYGNRQADIVTVIAMFYDLNDPGKFLEDVHTILDDDGMLVIQMSYTPLMIKQLAFDNICHEHVCYYSLTSLKYILNKTGFRIVDCELNDVNGGSFRVYAKKKSCAIEKFNSAPFRDVANFRIQSLLDYECISGFNSCDIYFDFYKKICALRDDTVDFIEGENGRGKRIWGYGASTKGNTLLQWYGLNNSVIDAIAERSSRKYGLQTVGTNIPIYSEDTMRKANPDYLLMLPWHFVNEFKSREGEYLKDGGAFITPCPKFEIIRGNNG